MMQTLKNLRLGHKQKNIQLLFCMLPTFHHFDISMYDKLDLFIFRNKEDIWLRIDF